jgi:hypothetical protein
MKTASARRALLAAGALVLLLATDIADAEPMAVTDRHEIPTFVLKRVELVTDADTQRREP